MQICLAIYHALIHVLHKEQYRNVTAVGYSAVIFGWMALLSASKQHFGTAPQKDFAASMQKWFGGRLCHAIALNHAASTHTS